MLLVGRHCHLLWLLRPMDPYQDMAGTLPTRITSTQNVLVRPHARIDHAGAIIALRDTKILIEIQNLIKGRNGLIELIGQGGIFNQ